MRSNLLPNPDDISFILFLLKTVDIPFLLILSASLSLFSRIDCDNTVFENSTKKAHFASVWAKPVFWYGYVMAGITVCALNCGYKNARFFERTLLR